MTSVAGLENPLLTPSTSLRIRPQLVRLGVIRDTRPNDTLERHDAPAVRARVRSGAAESIAGSAWRLS